MLYQAELHPEIGDIRTPKLRGGKKGGARSVLKRPRGFNVTASPAGLSVLMPGNGPSGRVLHRESRKGGETFLIGRVGQGIERHLRLL